MAEAIIPRRTINKQEYVLLADVTVGTATTSVDITGLNIGKEEEILLVSDVINATVNATDIYLYPNSNTTATNYYWQRLVADGSTIAATRSNENRVMEVPNGTKSFAYMSIKLTNNGYYTVQSNVSKIYGGGSIIYQNFYLKSTFTMTSITSLKVSSVSSLAIGIGSRFQLYKVGA